LSKDKKEDKPKASTFGKYKVEAVIMTDGINPHIFRRTNEFPLTIKYDNKKYKITANALFKTETSLLKRIKNLVFLIVGEYTILFREGETDPLIRFDSEISPVVLKVARTSTAAKRMIKEWFSGKRFPINKWVFIIIVASIGTFVYAKMSGMI
jgi:hypothetical protein